MQMFLRGFVSRMGVSSEKVLRFKNLLGISMNDLRKIFGDLQEIIINFSGKRRFELPTSLHS
jgi:hypothetical protein